MNKIIINKLVIESEFWAIIQNKNSSTVSILRYQIYISMAQLLNIYLFNFDFKAQCSRDIVL